MPKILRKQSFLKKIAYIQLFSSILSAPILADPWIKLAEEGKKKVTEELSTIRLTEKDFQIPRGWPPPLSVLAVEKFFGQPLDVSIRSTEWANQIENASQPSDVFKSGFEILLGTDPIKSTSTKRVLNSHVPENVPLNLKKITQVLAQAIAEAQPLLKKSVDSISPKAREDILSLYEWPDQKTGLAKLEISSRKLKKKYKQMESFNQKSLLLAGRGIFRELDSQLPKLQTISEKERQTTARWKSPIGTILIKNDDDHTLTKEDLNDVALYINLGGNNSYQTPVGTALDNQIRVAIDLGENVTVGSENIVPNAGAGIFGIGILALPNTKGKKTIDIFSYGQGCGIGGVGALIVNGPANIRGVRYVQGVGIFGVGLLWNNKSHGSTYLAERNGQGLGMTRGVGIFSHDGNDTTIKGGLVQPDPREPMGSISLCQGVGFGRRAYTGGGVGIAVIKGDRNSVIGSYFAQGCGYWHGFGLFRFRGNNSLLQARRYDQGSGVHSAFGHFQLFGNKNRVLNWGVGPSYGWDFSLGSALVQGSDNEFQATWGTGMASIGSLAYSYIKGDRNKLLLPSFGSGRFYRGRLAYSAQILNGQDNKIQQSGFKKPLLAQGRRMSNPWGVFRFNELTFEPDLKLEKPMDQRISPEKSVPRENINLPLLLEQAQNKDAKSRIGDLIDISSAFGHDKKTPRQALKELLSLHEDQVPLIIENLEPAAVEQLIRLNVVIPGYGDRVAQVIMENWDNYSLHKKLILLKFLGFSRPSLVYPTLIKLIENDSGDKDSLRLKSGAVKTLSSLLNKDLGQDPGLNAVLIGVQKFLEAPDKERKNIKDLFVRLRLWDVFSVLSICLEAGKEERLSVFEVMPEDITNKIDKKASEKIVGLIESNLSRAQENTRRAVATLEKVEALLRPKLIAMLSSTQTHNQLIAVQSIGQVGHGEDAIYLKPFLQNPSARVREQTAIAMGRMGKASFPLLLETFETGTSMDRKLVLASLPHAVIPEAYEFFKKGIRDSDPDVRLTTLAASLKLSPVLKKKAKKIHRYLRKRARKDQDSSVRLGAMLLPR